MTMGLRIRTQRNEINLTQPQLAQRLGLGIDMVKQLESDRKKPSIETLEKLSDIFKCSTDYLLGREISLFPPSDEDYVTKLKRLRDEAPTDEEKGLLEAALKAHEEK